MSQLDLAKRAGTTQRLLRFSEQGRSHLEAFRPADEGPDELLRHRWG
jgi:hypothetical protein